MLKKTLSFALCAITLAGCSDAPDKAVAFEEARAIATTDAVREALFQVTGLQRENGWAESGKYHLRYIYRLEAQQDYPGMLVEYARGVDAEARAIDELTRGSYGLQGAFLYNSDTFSKRLIEAAYAKSAELRAYASSAPQPGELPRAVSLTYGAHFLRDLGLPDNAPKGAEIPRQVTLTYMKTEKGWVQAN